MKLFIASLIILVAQLSFASTNNCRWVGDDFAEDFAAFSKSAKESLGWIVCDDIPVSSIILDKSAKDKMSLMSKIIKRALPDEKATRWTNYQKLSFGDKIIAESIATKTRIFHIFYFIEIKGKPYMMFAMLLDNKNKEQTLLAVDKVVESFLKNPKKFPKLLVK